MAAEANDPPHVLGAFIRTQRQMAKLSLRQLSALAEVSNPYLSQIERGLHEPSVRVLKAIADALNVSAETLFQQAGLVDDAEAPDDKATESAIRADPRLSEAQRQALLVVYRSYVGDTPAES
ncbi:MAG: helix-turn-helix transcriptional regulator [Geodermatophilaceae bacterium]|nr:helix-turn-helix transcriptional regulator [Geodermatophilaceae bacterium]